MIFELAIDSGATECFTKDDYYEIHSEKSEIYSVKKKLESKINNFISTEIEWIPLNSVEVLKENKEDTIKFLETLEEEDDIQNLYTNANFIQ